MHGYTFVIELTEGQAEREARVGEQVQYQSLNSWRLRSDSDFRNVLKRGQAFKNGAVCHYRFYRGTFYDKNSFYCFTL